MIVVKFFFNRFVNNDFLQILWTYVNFYNRTGHMAQMLSYTKHKINFPFSWVFRSKNSNFSPIFFSFKAHICLLKNWFWQFDKELSSFNQQHHFNHQHCIKKILGRIRGKITNMFFKLLFLMRKLHPYNQQTA